MLYRGHIRQGTKYFLSGQLPTGDYDSSTDIPNKPFRYEGNSQGIGEAA